MGRVQETMLWRGERVILWDRRDQNGRGIFFRVK
jgi:hypothetical protein